MVAAQRALSLQISEDPLLFGDGTLEEKLQLLQCFLNASENQGIIACDAQGRIIFYNDHAAAHEGLRAKDILGKKLEDVYHHDTGSNIRKVLATGKALVDVEARYRTAAGKALHSFGCIYPVYRNGALVAVFAVCRYSDSVRQLLIRSMELQKQLFAESKARCNGTKYTFDDICGSSDAIREAIAIGKKVAFSPSAVLIYGETGTGKELFAQSIHNAGNQKGEPFVAINCSAIPASIMESILFGTERGAFTGAEKRGGLFEEAGRGTLFLDEINSMPLELQGKLLRVLQERTIRRVGGRREIPVHCRVVSSANVDPRQCVASGVLRRDLYYRLSTISLRVPPLRERGEDAVLLAEEFCCKYARIYGKSQIQISAECRAMFAQYPWPGNVRELEHIVEQAVVMLDDNTLTMRSLPPHMRPAAQRAHAQAPDDTPAQLNEILRRAERQAIEHALACNDWNVTRAAAALGLARSNLQYRIKKLGLQRRGKAGESDCAQSE